MGPRLVELVHHRTDGDGKRPRSSMLSSSDLPEVTGGEDQRHAVGKRVFDVLDRARPLDFGERGVNDE